MTTNKFRLYIKESDCLIYTLTDIEEILTDWGYSSCEYTRPVENVKESFVCKDDEGYLIRANIDHLKHRKGRHFKRFSKSNPYSICNINHEASLKGLTSVCVDEQFDCKKPLLFRCDCNGTFYTTYNNFLTGHKIKCDECTGEHRKYTYGIVKQKLLDKGYELLVQGQDYKGITLTPLVCCDSLGYKCVVVFNQIMNGEKAEIFHPSNPFSLDNIRRHLELNNSSYECISNSFKSCAIPLEFRCKRCGEVIKKPWKEINRRNKDGSPYIQMSCPNCDGTFESTHASVLKQMFLHEYPDTIVEDRSFINPNTNCAMPTDIVNHRLKMAIEIQSQWHDFEDKKEKDRMKKRYWIERGYSFYDPDIRNYSVLEMCQLFFNIEELPAYVDFALNRKLNLKEIQRRLDNFEPILSIAQEIGVNPHRIYDAIYTKRLQRPEGYCNNCFVGVEQYDVEGNLLNTYQSISQAARDNNLKPKTLTTAVSRNLKCGGYYWKRINKEDVIKNA